MASVPLAHPHDRPVRDAAEGRAVDRLSQVRVLGSGLDDVARGDVDGPGVEVKRTWKSVAGEDAGRLTMSLARIPSVVVCSHVWTILMPDVLLVMTQSSTAWTT